jgi:hypothetical protein
MVRVQPSAVIKTIPADILAIRDKMTRGAKAVLEYPEMDVPPKLVQSILEDTQIGFEDPQFFPDVRKAYRYIAERLRQLPPVRNPTDQFREQVLSLIMEFMRVILTDVARTPIGIVGFQLGFVEDQIRHTESRWRALPQVYARLRAEILS